MIVALAVRIRLLGVVGICLLSVSSLFASDQELFNGRDLSGWVEMGPKGAFSVEAGELVLSHPANYPNWLRTEREYENFILRLEYMTPGWSESGVLLQAPIAGRSSSSGYKIHLRHDSLNEGMRTVGAVYDVAPPLKIVPVKTRTWNRLEIRFDWPRLVVKLNDELVQDLDLRNDRLKWRRRSGYIGLQDLGSAIRFRNLRIEELPGTEQWISLYNGKDLSGWNIRGEAPWIPAADRIVSKGGDGYLITDAEYSHYIFRVYVRTSPLANGGVFFRWGRGEGRGYEAQIYQVPDASNPTGSIYGIVPAHWFGGRDGEWFELQIVSRGSYGAVLVDGEKVAESTSLQYEDRGSLALQMHSRDAWIEFMRPSIRLLRDDE